MVRVALKHCSMVEVWEQFYSVAKKARIAERVKERERIHTRLQELSEEEEWERERVEAYKSMGWCSASSTYEEWKEERARRKEEQDDAWRRTFGTGFYWRKKHEKEKEQDKQERKRKREEAAGEGGATCSAGDEQDQETLEYEWVENGAAEQEADRKQLRWLTELEKL